jgi:hypothetical protein
MNYDELSDRLTKLGKRVGKQAEKLDGDDLGRSARHLVASLEKFELQLESFLASRKSREFLLEVLLRSPSSKRHLTIALLKSGLKGACGKRLKSEELNAAKREFIESIHEAGKQEEAVVFLESAFAEAIQVDASGEEKAGLQREFIQLGRLVDDEYAKEIDSRTIGHLRRVAEVNGIRFTDKTSKPRLASIIRRYARRAALNVRGSGD